MSSAGDAEVVLIGDGSHGTYEFYAHRANITKRLIEEKGFTAVAVEADWPDAFRVNRYIHDLTLRDGNIKSARDSLEDFERFLKWMWKNEVMPHFIEYLREHNDRVTRQNNDLCQTVSFFGMDLYSLHRSAEAVIKYFEKVDPEAAKRAKKQYNCFERFGEDTTRYAMAVQFGMNKTCECEVLNVLSELVKKNEQYIEDQLPDGPHRAAHPREEQFMAEMNALVVKDAEEYYRNMMPGDEDSWNLRDDHFVRTLVKIRDHLGPQGSNGKTHPAKIVVWAHNSHIGDARHTDMGWRHGEVNVGQRCRELFGEDNVFNIGFLTNRGTSIEKIFDQAATDDFFIITHRILKTGKGNNQKVQESQALSSYLNESRYQRFIGVIYRPNTEIALHYSKCSVTKQYDAVAHLKHSRGILPLEQEGTDKRMKRGEADVTFPFGQ
ncbi:erythromycin esterase [Neolentinus lepideus HHB14362 ss-1]|uniref:Erythromycin esterase n=1 Tax=Neolentinus lepideus HHB14362 ss-1 TaxID=1314782 RepID=A0A165PYJ6_9AGAM|nr:erythromycin esterase [Neolentinus lepideus HHB14362 ss-1]